VLDVYRLTWRQTERGAEEPLSLKELSVPMPEGLVVPGQPWSCSINLLMSACFSLSLFTAIIPHSHCLSSPRLSLILKTAEDSEDRKTVMNTMAAEWNGWASADQRYGPTSSSVDSVAFVENTASPFADVSYPFANDGAYSFTVSIVLSYIANPTQTPPTLASSDTFSTVGAFLRIPPSI